MKKPFDLDQRLENWTGGPLWRHLVALGFVILVSVIRWHHCVLSSNPLIDEGTYLAAFRALEAGTSPYAVGSYHYTPFFAWAGSSLLSAAGELGTLGALRLASLLGLAVTVWCSSAWLAVPWAARLALAASFVALAPAAGAGLCTGNISFAVIGVIVLALIHWSRRPTTRGAIPAGLALGATVAAKPLAPLALVALLLHRPAATQGDDGGRRHQIAGLVGA